MEGSTPSNSAHRRQGNPVFDQKCTFIERDEGQHREYLPWWGEVLLIAVGNSISTWGRITNYFATRVSALATLFMFSLVIDNCNSLAFST